MKVGGFVLSVFLAGCVSGTSRDWPQWRGSNRDGVSGESIGTQWPSGGPKVLWRSSVGIGFSSVSVAKGRAYTLGNTGGVDTVWCFDATTGREVWKHTYPAQLSPQWYEGGPGAAPTVDHGRVFTISKWGDVFCFDAAKGNVLWQRDLRQEGIRPNRWGFAGAPLVWGQLVIYNAGRAGIALDRKTGQVVWSSGTNTTGYASPVIFHFAGRECVLLFAALHLVAVDPSTGRELWRHPWKTDWDTNNTDPIVFGDKILITSFSRGSAMLAVKDGQPTVVYDNKALFNNLSPGVRVGNYLYAFSGEAKKDTDLRCLYLPTGEVRWTRKDPEFGSLLSAGKNLIVLSANGELQVFGSSSHGEGEAAEKPFPNRDPVARAKILSGTCWTPPALANGRLYARNAKGDLVCVDLRGD